MSRGTESNLGSSTTASRPPVGRAARGITRGVTARALVLAFTLMPLNVFFGVSGLWRVGTITGRHSLFPNAVALLFLFSLFNSYLRGKHPSRAFSAGELITIYSIVGIGTGLTGSAWDLGGGLAGIISYPFWFATPQNGWETLLWPNLPSWLTVSDRGVLEGFYVGNAHPYTAAALRAWAVPAVWWALLIGSMMWVCLCLNSLLRRRWADEEKLPFPMTVLPLALADEDSGLLHSRLFWIGAGIAAAVVVWNTLAQILPALPAIPLGAAFWTVVAHRHPWDLIRIPAFQWSPWLLGLCYLMPQDMALSLLVFDVLWEAEFVVTGQLGWCTSQWSGFPYADQQATGAFAALLITVLWLDRHYLAQVVRAAVGLESPLLSGDEEAFSARGAVLGALAGVAVLWCLLARAGLSPWVAPAFLLGYLGMSVMIARTRAQVGPPAHQFWGAMPNFVLPMTLGPRLLGPRAVGFLSLMKAFLGEQHNNPNPVQLEALKMADGGRLSRRRIALALAAAAPLAVLCYFWASIHFGYRLGLGTPNAQADQLNIAMWTTADLDSGLRQPADVSAGPITAMAVGALATIAMAWLKLRFLWWPLHPMAFPLALSSTLQYLPPVVFSTWLLRALLLRYGGHRAHRRVLPLFLGLLVGGATAEVFQRIILDLLGLAISAPTG